MEIFGIGLHVLVALFFAIHAVRNGQQLYWLFILFFFPLLGSVVYFVAIYLPELRNSRGAHVATQTVRNIVDPNRALREARQKFEMAATAENRIRLGNALLDAGDPQGALAQFEPLRAGMFATDSVVLTGAARAEFAVGDAAAAVATLERLFAAHPEAHGQAVPSLLYAEALARTVSPGTRAAFEAALAAADDAEPKCRYAEWLAASDSPRDREEAEVLFAEIVNDSKHWHKHARQHNRQWLSRAQSGMAAR